MRDPHIHVEKTPTPGFGQAQMRALITKATGLAVSATKTVGTGCGKRRPYAMTSAMPERVTCLACREWARAEQIKCAEMAEALLGYDDPDTRQALATAHTTREELAAQARQHRAMAARFQVTP
jgi:hypothetical protein